MKNGIPIVTGAIEIIGALAEFASALLDGKPETKPDLNRLLARIVAALALAKAP